MDYWYHATNEYFEKWQVKGVAPELKPELLPHSFISFTKDEEQLQGAGNGRCRVTLLPEAVVINLPENGPFSRQLWETFRLHPFGRLHFAAASFDTWQEMCSSGKILRPYLILDGDATMWRRKLDALPNLKIKWIVQQNFVRHWIEFVMRLIKSQGVDGVICNEHTNHGMNGEHSSSNLYIFKTAKISPPEWTVIPDVAARIKAKNTLKKMLSKDELRVIKSYPYYFSY
ncbi:hypothetical protein [Pantoea anthophila]|uniref:hypothetical protein n=1 Tax=Pantoea anthophila TaxID=470931 RepID=UPI00301CB68E